MRTVASCEPANTIIAALGGPSVVASAAGVAVHTVIRWRRPAAKGGTGGFVPRKHHEALASLAKSKGLSLAPTAFLDENTAREQLLQNEAAA